MFLFLVNAATAAAAAAAVSAGCGRQTPSACRRRPILLTFLAEASSSSGSSTFPPNCHWDCPGLLAVEGADRSISMYQTIHFLRVFFFFFPKTRLHPNIVGRSSAFQSRFRDMPGLFGIFMYQRFALLAVRSLPFLGAAALTVIGVAVRRQRQHFSAEEVF